jgi:ketosteroid isomerase-like protein
MSSNFHIERLAMRFVPIATILLLLTSALTMTASTAATSAGVDHKSALLQLEREWNEALRTKNVAWLEEHLADDMTDISSGSGALRTKSQDIAALRADTTTYLTLELSDLRVRIEGNAGIVTGVNHLTGRDDQGQPFDVRLSFTDTYINRNGRWLVWASQHTRAR